MKPIKHILPFALLALLYAGCKKDALTDTPYIELKSANPASIQAFSDTLTFTVFYKDGNGDLGENNPDVYNLFLKDNRNGITYKYRIQQLAPTGSDIAIQGNLDVKLASVPMLDDNNQTETATYSIYLVDRAGNQSNTVTSGNITITQ